MLRKIVLHGRLGKRFGRSFKLNVTSPAQAMRALMLQLHGFREHLCKGNYRIVRGPMSHGHDLDLDGCKLGLGSEGQLHIVPVVAGSASGLGKIIAGVALVALAFVTAGTSLAFTIPLLGVTSTSMIAGIGLSLALGGVAMMLAPAPKLAGGSATADRKDSFLFGGQDNVTAQGGPVPSVYGQFRTGSVIISAGLETRQLLG